MNFGKTFFASMLGSAVSFAVVGFVLIFVFIGMLVGSVTGLFGNVESGPTKKVSDKSVLHVQLKDPIIERGNENEFQIDFATFEPKIQLGLNHILRDIEKASKDDRIEGMFLDLSSVAASPSTLQDVREELTEFRESGKWILAYAENYSQSAYYLASAADEVYLYPEGGLEFYGLYTEILFFKRMLDKIGVDVQVVRGPNNKYKSAVEAFMLEEMSPENREQIETFLHDIWGTMTEQIAESRQLTPALLNTYADSLSVRLAEDAEDLNLVDGLRYRDEIMQRLHQRVHADSESISAEGDESLEDADLFPDDEEDVTLVTLQDYHKASGRPKLDHEQGKILDGGRVAVVYAVGQIEGGEGDDQTIGSDRIARALREARKDENVKAIVLRVNSPGGSALASDVIWRETELIKEAGKPFIVSMGDLAASGGYYIAAGADKIFANENTITGSIGVFGLIPNLERMLEDKIGLTVDRASTNTNAGILSTTQPLSEQQRAWLDEMITDVYDEFLQRVADGRGMSVEQVDQIAQGRVWSGTAAKEIGLIDEFGDLEDAIAEAAAMAELDDFRLRELPEQKDPFQEIMKSFGAEAKLQALIEESGVDPALAQHLTQVKNMVEGDEFVHMQMPFFFVISE